MATLILAAAGHALGGLAGLGGIGSVLGKAAGALAGGALDQVLFGSSRNVEGSRLADLSVQASNEGVSLPRIYGRVRLAGQVIWATRFEEVVSQESTGGKVGGSSATVTSYAYYANFAVALCEGPISRIGRIWADGKLLDTTDINLRIHTGTDTQEADPLISAVQETAPAYRGTAYVVFEKLALEAFGNRLPQLSFEVIRPVGVLEGQIRAMTIIPGAGEFVYAPGLVTETLRPGVSESLNRHVVGEETDWTRSIDELQSLCPNLESVALVVAWFGDDLRAGSCTIKPKVEVETRETSGAVWSVSGLAREEADLVSTTDGRPAFGGTPSDDTVIAAIADLKARGLEVMLYPFLLMDIPSGNGLPDPYGAGEQATYPWRGRVVADGSPAADVSAFMGSAAPGDFSVSGNTVTYSGPPEWSFRRHILHLAHLAEAAGDVDGFLIGSEMRGLTQSHAGSGSYPFVTELQSLAADVRSVLGVGSRISYAADWSEYGSHQPASDELRFPLDPLWAHADINFIGIDNYLPIADQRDGGDPDGHTDPYDLDGLRSGVAGGEDYDWYYASEPDREVGTRTPITDGTYGKPFVYRAKDLKGWWQNQHVERVGGIELGAPTAWVPESKPIVFTELGIPAIDRGANQPNVFVDPKSSESFVPRFSRGGRDDLIQRRALEALLSWWDTLHPVLEQGDNPVSSVYGGPMVEPQIHLWTWDARPYPAFPSFSDVWADGGNWTQGHWLTGRLGGASLADILRQILADFGISTNDIEVGNLSGTLEGLTVAGPVSPRQVIEPLLSAFDGMASDRGVKVLLQAREQPVSQSFQASDLAAGEGETDAVVGRVRAQASELASEFRLSAEDPSLDFQRRVSASRRLEGGSRQIESLDLPIVTSPSLAQQAADIHLHRIWSERERVTFSLAPSALGLEPGDVIELAGTPVETFDPPLKLRIEAIEDTDVRTIEAVRIGGSLSQGVTSGSDTAGSPYQGSDLAAPHTVLLDLPMLTDADPVPAPRIAAYASPWPGSLSLMRAPDGSGFQPILTVNFPASMGRLTADLAPGPLWAFDTANMVELELFGGHLESRNREAVLAGANALAVRSAGGGFEILQFEQVELTGERQYKLSSLLRGQKGTESEMKNGALSGADVVLLDMASVPLVPLSSELAGLELSYRLVPQGRALDDPSSLSFVHAARNRAARPLAPVHIQAERGGSGVKLSWIRQSRISAGSWEQVEVPLGETSEAYEVDILGPSDTVLRTLSAVSPGLLYSNAQETADFGGPVSELSVAICQLSETAGRGSERKETLDV